MRGGAKGGAFGLIVARGIYGCNSDGNKLIPVLVLVGGSIIGASISFFINKINEYNRNDSKELKTLFSLVKKNDNDECKKIITILKKPSDYHSDEMYKLFNTIKAETNSSIQCDKKITDLFLKRISLGQKREEWE